MEAARALGVPSWRILLRHVLPNWVTPLIVQVSLDFGGGLCEQAIVLYPGRVAETGPTAGLLASPAHPYTLALRSAVPELDATARRSRIILSGDIPHAASPPAGCPFHPRCPLAVDVCRVSVPALRTVASGRQAACHRAEEVLSGVMGPNGVASEQTYHREPG